MIAMYAVVRFFLRCGLWLYCRKIRVHDSSLATVRGPLILASNHPNAIFDALVLASCIEKPLHFTGRGDFADRLLPKFLMRMLRILPVYAGSNVYDPREMRRRMGESCFNLLREKGILVIFSEGITGNNWKLRPLKKLTARIWLDTAPFFPEPLQILPLAINYDSYKGPGKTIYVRSSLPIALSDLPGNIEESEKINLCNGLLRSGISGCMLQSEKNPEWIQALIRLLPVMDFGKLKALEDLPEDFPEKKPLRLSGEKPIGMNPQNKSGLHWMLLLLFAIPAMAGWLIHGILYYPLKWMMKLFPARFVYYDSLLFILLFFLYPLFCTALLIVVWNLFGSPWTFPVIIILPLLARITLVWKSEMQEQINMSGSGKYKNHFMQLFGDLPG